VTSGLLVAAFAFYTVWRGSRRRGEFEPPPRRPRSGSILCRLSPC